jgi:hypothetical protein
MSETPPQTPVLPPLPERVSFPVQLLEQWVTIPENERIEAPLTKQDIDNLLFGLLRGTESLTSLEQTLVHWSNGNLDTANKSLSETRRLNIESQNHFRKFFTGLMISALRAHGDD